jgi:hypothetical protein
MRILWALIFFFFFSVIFPKDLYAQQCINGGSGGGVECCVLDNDGECGGLTFPGSCDSQCNDVCPAGSRRESNGNSCYWSNQTPPPGGGQCTDPSAWGINCPAGTVKGTTIVNTQCKRPTYCAGAGTAQTYTNTCCAWQYFPDDCQLVWRPNQRRWDEVCYPVPPACLYNSLITYNCVPITPTCTVDVLPQTIAAGSGVVFPASIPTSSGAITQVDFVSSNPAIATVTTPDTIASYSSTVTGVAAGTTNITANFVSF